jgi:hypothetical protein
VRCATETVALLLRQKRYRKDGTEVVLVLPTKGSKEIAWFCELVGMPEDTYRRKVLQRVFGGALAKPIKVKSSGQIADVVRRQKGRFFRENSMGRLRRLRPWFTPASCPGRQA